MRSFLLENIRIVTQEKILQQHGIFVQEGKIAALYPLEKRPTTDAPVSDGKNAYALPGLIDLHIHGFAGHGPELGTPEELLAMSSELAKYGVTAFCPTLYCAKPDEMKALLEKLAPAFGQETGAKMIGFHLEGPFISPAKPGVMKPQDIAPADVNVLAELYQTAQGHISSMTLAPELKNIGPVIDFCNAHHILMQGGHTNATYEEFLKGAQLRVRHATHLFNAMSPLQHRAPGAAGAVLMTPEISCEIIADGVHVHPALVNFVGRVKPAGKVVLVTDALLPTGQAQGPFYANGEEVIFDGGVWKRKADKVIAGSALTMARGIKNLVDFGFSLPQATRCASTNPAEIIGLKSMGKLEVGYQADITLLDEYFEPVNTFINGKKVA